MSRYTESDGDEAYNNQSLMDWANTERALAGRRGREWLTKLRDELLAMPDKRIGHGGLVTATGAVCAVGAVVVATRVERGEDREAVLESLRTESLACMECTHGQHGADEAVCGAPTNVYDPMALYGGGDFVGRYSRIDSDGNLWMGGQVPGRCDCTEFRPDTYEAFEATLAEAERIGMPKRVAVGISYENDEGLTSRAGELADRDRYRQLLTWVEKQLARPPLTRPAPKPKRERRQQVDVRPTTPGQIAASL